MGSSPRHQATTTTLDWVLFHLLWNILNFGCGMLINSDLSRNYSDIVWASSVTIKYNWGWAGLGVSERVESILWESDWWLVILMVCWQFSQPSYLFVQTLAETFFTASSDPACQAKVSERGKWCWVFVSFTTEVRWEVWSNGKSMNVETEVSKMWNMICLLG